MKKRLILVLSIVALFLGGCGTGSKDHVQPDPHAHAQLNFANSRIIMPLDSYRFTADDLRLFNSVISTVIAPCMRGQGLAEDTFVNASADVGDGQYGGWDVARAKKYGLFPPEAPPLSQDMARKVTETRTKCAKENSQVLGSLTPPDSLLNGTEGSKISSQAYTLASDSPQWKQAREDWWGCLSKRGLTPRKGSSEWSSKEALDISEKLHPGVDDPQLQEQSIRVATTEAQCNMDVGMAQRLGDLEAGYQATLIKQNQAALNEEKKKIDAYVQSAKEYLNTHK